MKTASPTCKLHKAEIVGTDDNYEICYAHYSSALGAEEYYITLQPLNPIGLFEKQLEALQTAYTYALQTLRIDADTAILRRFYCSDPANQSSILQSHPLADNEAPCAVSIIGQAPLACGKVALCAYHIHSKKKHLVTKLTGNTLKYKQGDLSHYWTTRLTDSTASDSAKQSRHIFENYNRLLENHHMRLSQNVVRTWLYIRDVDSNYQGLVDARRDLFIQHGLTAESHYIASTGIEGRSSEASVKVSMDAYAVEGLKTEQVKYLQAPDFIGPTYLYGVSFERATAIAFRDRKHIYVSGTASIDPQGNVMHEGDVIAQLNRVLINIEALLQDAHTTLEAIAHFIVYLRDIDDASLIRRCLKQRFPSTPIILTWAPVCRPTWLIEIEAIAITEFVGQELPQF